MSKHSKACCTVPPVVAENYTPKGDYKTLDGLKTYVTGPATADTAILVIYDIFGFFPQIIQGADILAYGDKEHPMQVFMPDFFDNNSADIAWYPPDTEDKQKKLGEWFQHAAPPKHLPRVPKLLDAAEKENANIKSWGAIGYCWGGKMVSLIGGKEGSRIKAGAQTSPALVDVADAEKVRIPMLVMPSMDEDEAEFKKYAAALKGVNKLEYFGKMPHGWMSARGDLKDEECKGEYERGYQIALEFFNEHL